jgi:hypothetical protein
MDMGLMPSRDGNNYGFEFVKRNGKAFLNVQLLQNSMDAPKIIGSFRVKRLLVEVPSFLQGRFCAKRLNSTSFGLTKLYTRT